MKKIMKPSRGISFVALVAIVCCVAPPPDDDPVRELREVIGPDLGLALEGDLVEGVEENFIGVRSDELLLSRRSDSRTFFVQDSRFGVTRSGGIFEGSDDELTGRSRDVAVRLGVDPAEIAEASVIQVMSNVASVDTTTGQVAAEDPQRGERYGQLTRSVEGIPVFSSRVLMALDREGQLGFLELHWPDLSKEVLTEARSLRERVDRGWQPPEIPEARVESVEAGILHSPAVGLLMDIEPVIRVIYQPIDPEVGKKAVRYLNAQGGSVAIPRQFEKLEIPKEEKREAGEEDDGKSSAS